MTNAFAIAAFLYVALILVSLTDMWLARRAQGAQRATARAVRPRRREVQISEPIF